MVTKPKKIFLTISDEINNQIEQVVSDYGMSKQAIIRRALILYMKQYKETGRP
jgi:hypothetical protein